MALFRSVHHPVLIRGLADNPFKQPREMLRIFERNGHQEAGHYRADIVRYCTCYPKPLLKYPMPNHFSLYKRCRM